MHLSDNTKICVWSMDNLEVHVHCEWRLRLLLLWEIFGRTHSAHWIGKKISQTTFWFLRELLLSLLCFICVKYRYYVKIMHTSHPPQGMIKPVSKLCMFTEWALIAQFLLNNHCLSRLFMLTERPLKAQFLFHIHCLKCIRFVNLVVVIHCRCASAMPEPGVLHM